MSDLAQKTFLKFISNRSGPFDGEVVLDRSRVYILPTRIGFIFLLLLVLLLLGSINYGKSLGFMLTFMLTGLGNVFLFLTWKNLAGIKVLDGGASSVFAGENAQGTVRLNDTSAIQRYAIAINHNGVEHDVADVPESGYALLNFPLKTTRRGYNPSGKFKLATHYPSGLFVSWTWVDVSTKALAYPCPVANAEQFISNVNTEGDEDLPGRGLEEFSGIRKYHPGDSWRRISWKTTARLDDVYTIEYSGGQKQLEWISWDDVIVADVEKKLSVLARLLIDAETNSRSYGLRIPGAEIPPDSGKKHLNQCLKKLALYEA